MDTRERPLHAKVERMVIDITPSNIVCSSDERLIDDMC